MNDLYIYADGLTYCAVCAPAAVPFDDVLAQAIRRHPTDALFPWSLAPGAFPDGHGCTDIHATQPGIMNRPGARLEDVENHCRYWLLDDRARAEGYSNPCPCNLDPTRRHYLLACSVKSLFGYPIVITSELLAPKDGELKLGRYDDLLHARRAEDDGG